MAVVYILTKSFADSTGTIVGVFSTIENARQRQKEILSNPQTNYRPDLLYIDSIILDVGNLVRVETTRLDHRGKIISIE